MAVHTWGFGKYGQLGNGQTTTAETPQLLKLPPSTTPLQLSCGAHFTIILCQVTSKDGRHLNKLYACGWGKYGRLGTGSEQDCSIPTELVIDASAVNISQVSAGYWHGGCVTSEGDLYTWGYNKSHGILGLRKDEASPVSPFEPIPVKIPPPVDGGIRFKRIACGYNYSYAVGVDGSCWSWGSGAHGVLGHGNTNDYFQPTRVKVPGDGTVSFVSCGYSHAAVITDAAGLMTVGRGEDGALGLGKESGKLDKNTLQCVRALENTTVINASCSLGERHGHTLACTGEGMCTRGEMATKENWVTMIKNLEIYPRGLAPVSLGESLWLVWRVGGSIVQQLQEKGMCSHGGVAVTDVWDTQRLKVTDTYLGVTSRGRLKHYQKI